MKIRKGFVSNSSSTSFIVENLSDEKKTLFDFAKELSYMVQEFKDEYGGYEKITVESFLDSANLRGKREGEFWNPKERIKIVFGDEEGTDIGVIFDYMLRSGGKSDNFKWNFHESLR